MFRFNARWAFCFSTWVMTTASWHVKSYLLYHLQISNNIFLTRTNFINCLPLEKINLFKRDFNHRLSMIVYQCTHFLKILYPLLRHVVNCDWLIPLIATPNWHFIDTTSTPWSRVLVFNSIWVDGHSTEKLMECW